VLESGVPANQAAGVAPASGDARCPAFDVASGAYRFSVKM